MHTLTAGIGRHLRANFVLKPSPKVSPVAKELTLSNPLSIVRVRTGNACIVEIVLAVDDDDWICQYRFGRQHSNECSNPECPFRHQHSLLRWAIDCRHCGPEIGVCGAQSTKVSEMVISRERRLPEKLIGLASANG